jgi:hypothetical protein
LFCKGRTSIGSYSGGGAAAAIAANMSNAICVAFTSSVIGSNENSTKGCFVYFGLSSGETPDKKNAWLLVYRQARA